MIRGPDSLSAAGARATPARRAWIWALLLLVVLTWTPVVAVHVRNMSVADSETGTLIAIFPPTASTREVFHGIVEAKGAPVASLSWIPRAWVVQSAESGFAGRLRQRGAWGVYSPKLLSVRQVLSCSGMVRSPAP